MRLGLFLYYRRIPASQAFYDKEMKKMDVKVTVNGAVFTKVTKRGPGGKMHYFFRVTDQAARIIHEIARRGLGPMHEMVETVRWTLKYPPTSVLSIIGVGTMLMKVTQAALLTT